MCWIDTKYPGGVAVTLPRWVSQVVKSGVGGDVNQMHRVNDQTDAG